MDEVVNRKEGNQRFWNFFHWFNTGSAKTHLKSMRRRMKCASNNSSLQYLHKSKKMGKIDMSNRIINCKYLKYKERFNFSSLIEEMDQTL